MKTALITGASSGLGADMAQILSAKSYHVILVARREDRLIELQSKLSGSSEIILCDLSKAESLKSLCDTLQNRSIDFWVLNAGFGTFGRFETLDLSEDQEMIRLNVTALHTLLKLAVKPDEKRKVFILAVASMAATMPGPMMSTYYATKAYVLRLCEAVQAELKAIKSPISLSVLCPGPVKTEFNRRAAVSFALNGMSSPVVAKMAIEKTLQGRRIIVPGTLMKFTRALVSVLPNRWLLPFVYHFSKSLTVAKK